MVDVEGCINSGVEGGRVLGLVVYKGAESICCVEFGSVLHGEGEGVCGLGYAILFNFQRCNRL